MILARQIQLVNSGEWNLSGFCQEDIPPTVRFSFLRPSQLVDSTDMLRSECRGVLVRTMF